jgi:sortase A
MGRMARPLAAPLRLYRSPVLFSRILGGVGRTLIAAGALILLFVVYQLWGTGLRTSAAQDSLRDQFTARQAEVDLGAATTTAPPTTATGAPATAPATAAPQVADPAAVAAPRPGDPVGQIQIPDIGADFVMVEGVDLADLSQGPGHFPGTPLPGQPGNAAIAGHRTTYAAPFNRIDELVPGNQITVTTLQGTFTYEVVPAPGSDPAAGVGHWIITPYQTEILDQTPDENTLTLMACHPKFDLKQRIVVRAKLVSNPAPATAPSAESRAAAQLPSEAALLGGSGSAVLVGGETSAWGSAILFGLLAGVVWFATWFLARRWPSWRQWPRWAMFAGGCVIFAVPMFLAFENINRLLPAGY